jgi:hypothetical protein
MNLTNKDIVEVCNSCLGNSNVLLYERGSVDFGTIMNHFLKEQIMEAFFPPSFQEMLTKGRPLRISGHA